ncbi:MAG TPA: ferritin [Candidatus Paceibacterota bacterium]|nr:ferritin [Verrucomicrobiota bacterium]HOX02121.1 ferritin [Verrucomicrobiota bacterium]HRZ44937.1 ferritin [Candidatus Paceibacterota bacterium]
MKLPTKVEKALNDQINLELSSAYAYLGMAAYFDSTPFTGFAAWMKAQAQEELGHVDRFYRYIVERNGKVALKAIAEPKCEYKSPLDAFQAALKHEQTVSASICSLYELAAAEKDYPTVSLLKWFIDEQVEEESNTGEMVAKLELIGENRNGLFHLDHRAGERGKES